MDIIINGIEPDEISSRYLLCSCPLSEEKRRRKLTDKSPKKI